MRFFRWLFPFAFRKRDLAKYTTLTLWIGISLVLASFFAFLFLKLGGWWRYLSIPFWGLLLYDVLSAVFSTLYFLELVDVVEKPKKQKAKKPETQPEADTPAPEVTETPEAPEKPSQEA